MEEVAQYLLTTNATLHRPNFEKFLQSSTRESEN